MKKAERRKGKHIRSQLGGKDWGGGCNLRLPAETDKSSGRRYSPFKGISIRAGQTKASEVFMVGRRGKQARRGQRGE